MRTLLTVIFVSCLFLAPAVKAADGEILAVNIEPSGWQATVKIAGLGTGGTYADRMGLGINNRTESPNVPLVTFLVTSKSWTDAGVPTTLQRYVYGVKPQRLPYPNHENNDEVVDGPDVVVKLVLSHYIFDHDDNTLPIQYSILPDFYTSGPKSNLVGTGTATNSSTVAYRIPKLYWKEMPYQKIDGNSLALSAEATHLFPQDGRPVVGVKFTATDGTNLVSTMVNQLTFDIRKAGHAVPVQEYNAILDVSTLNDGVITCNCIAYPWVGDLVNDSASGQTQPDWRLGPLPMLLDRTNNYGVTRVKVDAVNGSDTGALTAYDQSVYNPSTAYEFATIAKAARAARDYNNTNHLRNDIGAVIIDCDAGNYNVFGNTISGGYGGVPATWCTIKPTDGLASGSVVLSGKFGDADLSDRVKIQDCKITSATNNTFSGIQQLWFQGGEFDSAGEAVISSSGQESLCYVQDALISQFAQGLHSHSAQNLSFAVYGCTYNGFVDAENEVTRFCGNLRTGKNGSSRLFLDLPAASSNIPNGPKLISHNLIYGFYPTSAIGIFTLQPRSGDNTGMSIIQNVFEYTVQFADNSLGQICANDDVGPYDDIDIWNNVFLGQRVQIAYNSQGTVQRDRRYWSMLNNFWHVRGMKGDLFGTPNGNRIGAWPVFFHVNSSGNIDQGYTPIAAGGFDSEYEGLHSIEPGSTIFNWPIFRNLASSQSIESDVQPELQGTGMGDYHTKAGSPLIGLPYVRPLRYAIDKVERHDDNDSSGPYTSGGTGVNVHGTTITIQGKTLNVK